MNNLKSILKFDNDTLAHKLNTSLGTALLIKLAIERLLNQWNKEIEEGRESK